MDIKKILLIAVCLFSILSFVGCTDYNHYTEEKTDEGILKDVEIINGDMVVYWNRSWDSFIVYEDGFSTWDYLALKNIIGEEIRINLILHIDSEDGTLRNSWAEFVDYEFI